MCGENRVAPTAVLVTGVGRFLGAHLAARLAADPSIERVLGVDTVAPPPGLRRMLGRAEFVRADIRNPLIAKVIANAEVDTVVHAALTSGPVDSGGRAATKEMNVIGTMQLLAACQRSPRIRRLVVKSTTAVYGASPRDPAIVTETMASKSQPSGGYARDASEIEGYVRSFGRRRPDVTVTVLRFANFVGPRVDTSLTRYLSLPVVPTVLGYDARMQLLHSEDALAVLEQAVRQELPGVYNVGASGVLLLSQAIRRAGRLQVSLPGMVVGPASRFLGGTRLLDFSSEQMRFLNFGRVVDTTKLRETFGFTPRWTTVQAFDDFVRGHQLRPLISPARVSAVEQRVLATARALR
jgi:UDP-glucose 4-epimerase